MKKKILTFLLAVCLILPCALFVTACDNEQPVFNGYEVFINGTKTDEFQCVANEDAITPEDVTIKSNWSDEKNNQPVPLNSFDISVKWINESNSEQTTFPNFWTNGTGSTSNDFATTYEFTLTKDSYNVTFKVIILPIEMKNCRVKIFDGTQLTDNAEMIWGHNEQENDPTKHVRFEIENLDANYNKQEHIQWAVVNKEIYDSLTSTDEKKEYIKYEATFSTGQIYSHMTPKTYYVFALIPDCNNIKYGEDSDGYIYNYATLTILPIELQQVKNEDRILQHDDFQYQNDFNYLSLALSDEITNLEAFYVTCNPYVFENNGWNTIENWVNTTIKVNAVQTADGYKMVELKDHNSSLTEWVFVNSDGTQGDVVADNTQIKLIDYHELADYKNGTSVTISVYYKVADMSEFNQYYNYSKVFKTKVKIRKYINVVAPTISPNSGGQLAEKYVTAINTFEFSYGEKYQLTWATILQSPEEIMQNVISNSSWSHYSLIGFNQTEYSEDPYYGYVTLNSKHYAWKLDGVNYTSEPLVVTYYINKAEISKPQYKHAVGNKDYFTNPIELNYDSTLSTYKIDNYITIDNIENEDVSFNMNWINVYIYTLTNEDLTLTITELTSKVKTNGTIVEHNGNLVPEADNEVGKTFVVMFELTNTTNTIWTNGINTTNEPVLYKFEII